MTEMVLFFRITSTGVFHPHYLKEKKMEKNIVIVDTREFHFQASDEVTKSFKENWDSHGKWYAMEQLQMLADSEKVIDLQDYEIAFIKDMNTNS